MANLYFSVVSEQDRTVFMEKVNMRLEEGYRLQGGTTFSPQTEETYQAWTQAIVFEEGE